MLASEIITDVQAIFGDRNQVQVFSGDIIRWINDGALKIARKTECLIATASPAIVEGDNSYPLTSFSPLKFKRVVIDGNTIGMLPAAFIDEVSRKRFSSNDVRGTPKWWYREGNEIVLYPTPDRVMDFDIVYVRRPGGVTVGPDPIDLPDEFCEPLKGYCLGNAYELDDNFEMAKEKKRDFNRIVEMDATDWQTQQADSYPSIRPVGDDWW